MGSIRQWLALGGVLIVAAGGLVVDSLAQAEHATSPPARLENRLAPVVDGGSPSSAGSASPTTGPIVRAQATARTVSYTYDANGRLTGVNYGDGKSITYGYDNAGNRTQQVVVGAAASPTPTTTPGPGTPTVTTTPGAGTPTATTSPGAGTPTGTTTPGATPTPTQTPVATATTVATIAPTPGATQVVSIPGGRGNLFVPGDAAGTTPLIASIPSSRRRPTCRSPSPCWRQSRSRSRTRRPTRR